ncbi:hypothetical protein P3T23_009835, partial [Paraburkholderia sp. GAS448]
MFTFTTPGRSSGARHKHYARGEVVKVGGFKSEAQQGANEWKLSVSKRLRAYVRRPRM